MTRLLFVGIVAGVGMLPMLAKAEDGKPVTLKVIAYNVACGQWTTPEQVAEALRPMSPDIVFLNEVPKANRGKDVEDWSSRVAKKLNLPYVYVGSLSSARHKAPRWGDITGNYGGKFKSVLSRTPLTKGKDCVLKGKGWGPAGVVRVETEIGGRKFALYSVHLPGRTRDWSRSTQKKFAELIAKENRSLTVIAAGDFNETSKSLVYHNFLKTAGLKDATPAPPKEYLDYCKKHGFYLTIIDHIVYRTTTSIKVLETKVGWGPKNMTKQNKETKGHLSDHPWVFSELEVQARGSSK